MLLQVSIKAAHRAEPRILFGVMQIEHLHNFFMDSV